MFVGFSGTRSGPTPAQHASMRRLLSRLPITRLIHGGARGCDVFAHDIVRSRGIAVEVHPADGHSILICMASEGNYEIHPMSSPLERNRTIVSRSHGLIAVPRTDREGDSGTWMTIRYAREAGRPVYIVQQNGRIVRDRDPAFD